MVKVEAHHYYEYLARCEAIAAFSHEPTPQEKAAQFDFNTFGQLIAGFQPASHHHQWLSAILTHKSSQALNHYAGQNLRIEAPRGSAKTTWISIAVSNIIGHNPHVRIILCSYSEEIALSISVAIKSILESPQYQQIFPNIQPSKRWRDGHWTINRSLANITHFIKDPTLLAVGMGGSINSRRSDLIIIDDPIKSREAIANPQTRENMRSWWSGTLRPTLVPGGRVIVLCTRKRIDDIHGTTWTTENGWKVLHQQAITNNNQSYWPEYITLEELEQIRQENPITFACEYQNDPLDESLVIIKPEWVKRSLIPNTITNLVLGVDLAISQKESADYTALVLMGINRETKTIYGIDWKRGRWTLNQTIEEINKLAITYTKFKIVVESVAYQAAFKQEYKRIASPQMRINDIHPRGDKETRLRGISGLFETGKIIFNEAIAWNELIDELTSFGSAAHDDTVDALVYAVNELNVNRVQSRGGEY